MINQLVSQRYEVLEKIGDGPLFTVYKARDKVMNRVVALKAVAGAFAGEPGFLSGLERGFQATANLNHPNITHFYEWANDGDSTYATVEYVRGIDLRERIRRIAPFTLSVAVDVAVALGEALQYAHSAGQTHGDLRPHNVIISPEGAVKVTDFGVMAGAVQSARARADVGARAAAYRAPEFDAGQAGSVAGDIYALGAVLYEMLTGAPLYAGDSLDAIADMQAYSPIPLPRVINPGVPRSLEGIIVKCLQKRPDARYRSAGEALNDLKSVRDALRFGKPLSWSPVDVDKLANDVPVRRAEPSADTGQELEEKKRRKEEKKTSEEIPAFTRLPQPSLAAVSAAATEPVADVAASSQVLSMPANNRLRRDDERVSIVLKIAVGVVTSIIIGCLIVIAGIYSSKWIEPEPVVVPKLIGKTIEDVRAFALQKKIHLIEHTEYSARPRGIVYRADKTSSIKEGHDINIWYSKGQTYIPVPKVVGLAREEAEKRLKDAGLTVGKITPEYSSTVPAGSIISQNVTYKKTVLHDTPVGLVVSDGPKSDFGNDPNGDADNPASPTPPEPDANTPADNPDASTSGTPKPDANPNPPDDPANNESHEFTRVIRVQKDGLGKRKVRIEYADANGLSVTPVTDEVHAEGDRIPLNFTYFGKKITLRVYYNDQLSWTKTFDPLATKHEVVR